MNRILPIMALLCLLINFESYASSVKVSSFYDGSNTQAAFLNAKNFAVSNNLDTIIIDKYGAGIWNLEGTIEWTYLNNKTIFFEYGVVVQSKPNTFVQNTKLFNLRGLKNSEISGYGATVRMFRDEFPGQDVTEQFGHNMFLGNNPENVTIKGLNIFGSGGDGITLVGGTDINIYDVIIDHHKY